MEKKKILVIGAAQSCLGIIGTIKRLGHLAVVVGSSTDLPGYPLADYYLLAEDNDVESVVKYCKEIGVDGIVPTPVDRPLVWMAKVAKELGLIFISPNTAEAFRHKYKMKEHFQRANVLCAKGILTTKERIISDIEKFFNFPLILKPIDGYASRGVVKADNLSDLEGFVEETSSFSSDASIVVEEFIDGREFNAEGVCYQGNVEIYAIVEKVRDPFPRTVEMGHIVPPDITPSEEELIVKTISDAVLAMGMDNGAFNAEIKLHQGKGYVIEVNGRLAGDFIVSHLLKPTTGQDMEEAVVNISLGIKPEKAKRNYTRHGMISFFNLPEGKKINEINDFNYLYDDPDLIWAYLFFKKGDVIPKVLHMGHRSGFVIATAESRKHLQQRVEAVKGEVMGSVVLE
jgi:biotin carboxylase